jgi:hypothetical protein
MPSVARVCVGQVNRGGGRGGSVHFVGVAVEPLRATNIVVLRPIEARAQIRLHQFRLVDGHDMQQTNPMPVLVHHHIAEEAIAFVLDCQLSLVSMTMSPVLGK